MRTATAPSPVARALERAGASMLACADIEEAVVAAPRRRRAGILVFGALSVSDLVRTLRVRSRAHHLDAHGCARRRSGGRAARPAHALPPEDRHRHEPARVPARQPARASLPELLEQLRTSSSPPSTRTSRPRMTRNTRSWTSSARAFEHALATLDDARRAARARGMPPTAPRFCATRASGSTAVRPGLLLYGVVPPPLATTRAAAAGDAVSQPRRVDQGHSCRARSVGYGATLHRRRTAHDRGRASRLCRRSGPSSGGPRVTCSWPGDGRQLSAPVCMDMITIDVTGARCDARRRGRDHRSAGRRGRIDVREMAAAIGTIPWEVLCRIGSRIERVYRATPNSNSQLQGIPKPRAKSKARHVPARYNRVTAQLGSTCHRRFLRLPRPAHRMKPPKALFVCQECGAQSPKWLGRCADCGAWNSLVEERVPSAGADGGDHRYTLPGQRPARRCTRTSRPRPRCGSRAGSTSSIACSAAGSCRARWCCSAVSRASASPRCCCRRPPMSPVTIGPVLYSSGEESEHQVKSRGERLGVGRAPLYLLAETCLERDPRRGRPASAPRSWSSTRSRPCSRSSCSPRPAASDRFGRRRPSCCSRPRARTSRHFSSGT